jgi:hypothetical protein
MMRTKGVSMQKVLSRIDWRRVALAGAPLAAIVLAALAIRTPLAADYPVLATILFVWVLADSLMLAFLARTSPDEVEARTALAILAGAFASAAVVMPPPFRAALLDLPVLAGAMAAVVAAHLGWGLVRARARFAQDSAPIRERAAAALGELVPERLARLMIAELTLLRLALFRWGSAPDVPEGQAGFDYHRHLVPIFSVLLVLQGIEIAVVHLLVSLWSPKTALILFVLSDLALLYMIGLLKSFRLRPVLAGEEGVRIRTGILIERFVRWEDVAEIRTCFSSEDVKRATTENAALLAWPNLLVTLAAPAERRSLFGTRPIEAVAFRLDDPLALVRFAAPRLAPR